MEKTQRAPYLVNCDTMKIRAINAYKVNVPFKFTWCHSKKDPRSTDNIVLEIVGADEALRGYGEGAPRPYITGNPRQRHRWRKALVST